VLALLTCVVAMTPFASAQAERPQIQPGERKAPRKKDAGPRAVAVLRLGDKGKVSLVPIAILINGKFWDASAYKADPVPMALDSGTVYEAEQAGSSLGLFTVNAALHSNAVNAAVPWIGTGAWHPAGADEPKVAQKAESAPVGIDKTDQPPRLTHDPAKTTSPATTTPGTNTAPASGTAPASNAPPAAPTNPGSDGDGPPRLSRGSSPPSAASPTPPADSAPKTESKTEPKAESKTDSKPAPSKADDRADIPASDSSTNEANRPRLRRGKPAESFADEDVPGYSLPSIKRPSSTADTGKIVVTAAAKSDVKLIPAISDAGGPTPHSYVYEWLKDEEGDRRKQITALAKQQVQAYVIAQDKAKITPTHPQPAKSAAVKVKEPIFEDEQMVAYDLWNTNQPVLVFSAEAHLPPPLAGKAHSEVTSDLHYSVLVVAYPDIYNNLHKLYAGVTDKFHLDITPKLELVDAVDADGDNRGELLFSETSDAGPGWIIYRATADKLYKMFDSLNPE